MDGLSGFSRNLIILFLVLTFFSSLSLKSTRGPALVLLTILASLAIYIAFLYFFAGFPAARPSFSMGSDGKLTLLLTSIFVCVILGTIAEYFFGLGESLISWRK